MQRSAWELKGKMGLLNQRGSLYSPLCETLIISAWHECTAKIWDLEQRARARGFGPDSARPRQTSPRLRPLISNLPAGGET